MAENTQQPPNKNEQGTWVATHEPSVRPAPLLETGWLAWVRANLFSSEVNIVLTFIGFFISIFSIWAVWTWTVQTGNWFTISFNFRIFMLNQYEPLYEWRVVLALLSSLFVVGMAIAVWVKQAARVLFVISVATILIVWGVPPIASAIYNLPTWFTAAGNADIVSGSATERPVSRVAFTGQAGEEITLQISDQAGQNDAALSGLTGFLDVATNTLRNAAENRLNAIREENDIYLQLEDYETSELPTLTEGQLASLQADLANDTIPQRVVEQYDINSPAESESGTVKIELLQAVYQGDNQWEYQSLAEPVLLGTLDDVAKYTLPSDGWYILEKTIADESSSKIDVLSVTGVYPLLQSTSFDTETGGFVDTFRRLTDFYSLAQPVPRVDGVDVPFVVITQNQFRGERQFGTYLRTYVSPFFTIHALNITILLVIGVAGYVFAVFLRNNTESNFVIDFASYAMISLPILIWILVNGLTLTALTLWVLVAGIVLLISAMGTFGKMQGSAGWRNLTLPIALLVIYGLVFGVAWFADGGGLTKILVYASIIPLVASTVLGTGAHSSKGLEDDERSRMMTNFGIATLIFIGVLAAFVLGWATVDTSWALSPSNPSSWGGLLLTMLLTIFGIILAFPIGVGLALGRRSDLPAVSAICTGYIELVRGSPFITVLFFMQLLIPLINQDFANVPNSYRALIAVVLFSAAYLAENIRGGLQSLPPGQVEAAKALGLNAWQTTRLITMPQALRAVIPALVGQFISLFKDTSLVAIVGLTDLTRVVNTIVVQAAFIGTRREGLLFISIIYFVFSYAMGYISRLLEASGSGGTRRM